MKLFNFLDCVIRLRHYGSSGIRQTEHRQLARFIRVPGGFIIGSGFALKLLGVPDEQALAMILFNHVLSIVLMVGPGLLFLWRSGVDIRDARTAEAKADAAV